MLDSAERYAGFVTRDMLVILFDKLKKHLNGNKTKAAEQCDLTRKTIDDWGKSGNVKLDTREKVLEQLIDELPIDTFGYLTNQLSNSSTDSLMSYLSTIYETTFNTTNTDEFLQLANQFEHATRQYAGLIYNKLDHEVNDMIMELENHAKSAKIEWSPTVFHLYDSEQIKHVIPQIINSWVYSTIPQTREEMALMNKVPREVIDIVGDTLNKEFFPIANTTYSNQDKPFVNEPGLGTEMGYYIFNKPEAKIIVGTAFDSVGHTSKPQLIFENENTETNTS